MIEKTFERLPQGQSEILLSYDTASYTFKKPDNSRYAQLDKSGQNALKNLGDDYVLSQSISGIWPNKQVMTEEKILNVERETLTQRKYNALLAITTGDSDIYAFGAENRYHAVKYQNDIFGVMKKHTIVSDTGVGESTWGWGYEYQFREGGKYYKEQQKGYEIWETK